MQQFLAVFAFAAAATLIVATLLAGVIGRSGFSLPSGGRRLGCVDGLRGYLALSVMIHHFFIWIQSTRLGGSWTLPSINFINQLGAGSVGLFFMTTGFVFYPRILAGLRSTSWLTVYVGRFFRIMPLVILSVGLVTAIIMARIGATPDFRYIGAAAQWISTWSQPPLLGYPDSGRINAYVLWSLWHEWLFYLFILPACAAAMDLVRIRQLPTWTVPVALLGIGIAARLAGKLLDCPVSVLFYLPLFAAGMLAFELQSRPAARAALLRPGIGFAAMAALLLGMVATRTPYNISLPLFGCFFVCVACGNDLGGLLRNRGALVLGECSFGIYLLHGLLLDLLFVDGGALLEHLDLTALPLLLPIAGTAVVLATSATYLLIERPAIRSGKSFSRWLTEHRIRLDSRELEVAR